MNWINFLWPIVTGACLTLGLINLRISLTEKPRAARLLFSLSAFSVALVSVIELALMRSESPAHYEALLPWGDFATWMAISSLTAFVWVFFGEGIKWIALAGSAAYGGGLLFYLGPGSGLLYLEITGLRTVETFGGETYRVAEGVPNPWGMLGYAGVLLMLIFSADASVRLWRRGNRRRAVVVGGSLVFFILTASVQSFLIERGHIHTPYLISWFYLAILVAMGHELTRDVFAATRMSEQLRESEERMGLAAEAANLGMWVWDVSGDDAWMTERGRSLFGFEPGARIDNAAILDHVHPEDRAAREAALRHAMETQGKYEMEYRVQLADGGVRWISARGRCLGTKQGCGQKLLGVSMDVTARKEAERDAVNQRDELEHLSRVALVGEMATSLAHELNQPLTAMVTNASAAQRFLAKGKLDPEELRELLADITADGRRAGEVIRGIKGMVRKVESERSEVDINGVIADVLRLVRADALAHGCLLATDLAPDLPKVTADPVQLQQVLLNMIINSFDAMRQTPCDPCRVEIASKLVEADTLEVSVRDFGPGLPPEKGASVFDRFFSTKHDGMGMGLAIARSMIEAHHGTLGAENAEGGGARFWFCLPAGIVVAKEETA